MRLDTNPQNERGLTLLEVVVAAGILSVVLLLSFGTADTTTRAQGQIEVRTRLETDARNTLSAITRRLRGAGFDTLEMGDVVDPPDESRVVRFSRVAEYDADGRPVWGKREKIAFRDPDGSKGWGEGVVFWKHDGRLQRLPGQARKVRFSLVGRTIRVRLVAVNTVGGEDIRIERTADVTLRN
jgi:hypothetical protein